MTFPTTRTFIYSSLRLSGSHEADHRFEPVHAALGDNPCVRYHGGRTNTEVRDTPRRVPVLEYPSVYAEISCLAAQEALMAGCLWLTSSLGGD